MTPSNGRRPASGSVRCAASIDLRTVDTEIWSDGLYAISRNSPIREFPGTGNFSGIRGKSSPVNILFQTQTNLHHTFKTQSTVDRQIIPCCDRSRSLPAIIASRNLAFTSTLDDVVDTLPWWPTAGAVAVVITLDAAGDNLTVLDIVLGRPRPLLAPPQAVLLHCWSACDLWDVSCTSTGSEDTWDLVEDVFDNMSCISSVSTRRSKTMSSVYNTTCCMTS